MGVLAPRGSLPREELWNLDISVNIMTLNNIHDKITNSF